MRNEEISSQPAIHFIVHRCKKKGSCPSGLHFLFTLTVETVPGCCRQNISSLPPLKKYGLLKSSSNSCFLKETTPDPNALDETTHQFILDEHHIVYLKKRCNYSGKLNTSRIYKEALVTKVEFV